MISNTKFEKQWLQKELIFAPAIRDTHDGSVNLIIVIGLKEIASLVQRKSKTSRGKVEWTSLVMKLDKPLRQQAIYLAVASSN